MDSWACPPGPRVTSVTGLTLTRGRAEKKAATRSASGLSFFTLALRLCASQRLSSKATLLLLLGRCVYACPVVRSRFLTETLSSARAAGPISGHS